jgi:hypothetical protein
VVQEAADAQLPGHGAGVGVMRPVCFASDSPADVAIWIGILVFALAAFASTTRLLAFSMNRVDRRFLRLSRSQRFSAGLFGVVTSMGLGALALYFLFVRPICSSGQ